MTLTVLPFTAQLPAGYRFPADTGSAEAAVSTPSAAPVDTVGFGNTWQAGSFTAKAGDRYRMSDLFHGSAPAGKTIAGYRIALGGGGNGTLLLNGNDVSRRTKFTADEFAHLTFAIGANGLPQDLVVVAQTGTRLANGTLTHITDSPAVQITAKVTGVHSIDALNALATPLAGAEARVASIATEASIYTGSLGASRPTLQTAGNFTAAAGDVYRLGDLFHGTAPTGQTIAGYRVALSGDGNGTLMLGGKDVSSRSSFTADEFARLTYKAGGNASAQNLVVVAQIGTRLKNGALTHVTDSALVQVTADVTGERSVNALPALATTLAGSEANVASIVREAGIYTGSVSQSRPTLQTVGNFTAATGDTYRLGDLFQGSAPAGQAIAGYRVALGGTGNGRLLLSGHDVGSRTSFTADEFAHLTYTVGANGSPQDLVVVAQTGTRLKNGTLAHITDSAALRITATTTGVRSINALKALTTPLSGAEATIANIASEAGIYTGSVGASRPTLQTAGNFTARAGDAYRLSDLFHGSAPTGQTIAGYRIALGGDGDGTLRLNGQSTSKTSFTAEEFARLTYTVGGNGSLQSLVVVAQTGTRLANGKLIHITDSEAIHVVATPSADRSLNALNALATPLAGAEAWIAGIVSEVNIYTGSGGSNRPAVQTLGNFTAMAGDKYRLADLFHGSAPAGEKVAGYRVALGGSGNGALLLNGSAIGARTSFTADEFARLTYTAGENALPQDIVVAAQTGTRLANGTLKHITDSPAVRIIADVGSTRSLHALPALVTALSGGQAEIAKIASEASIYTGLASTGRPALLTALKPEPSLPLTDLVGAVGNFQSTGGTQSAAIDLLRYYPTATGSSVSPGNFIAGTAAQVALAMLNASASGSFSVIGDLAMQSQAIKAYTATMGL